MLLQVLYYYAKDDCSCDEERKNPLFMLIQRKYKFMLMQRKNEKKKICKYKFMLIQIKCPYPLHGGHFGFRPSCPPGISIPDPPPPPGKTISVKNAVALYHYAKDDCSCDKERILLLMFNTASNNLNFTL